MTGLCSLVAEGFHEGGGQLKGGEESVGVGVRGGEGGGVVGVFFSSFLVVAGATPSDITKKVEN